MSNEYTRKRIFVLKSSETFKYKYKTSQILPETYMT